MREFVGRERELSRLEDIWNGSGTRAVAVYGRRRIGKSELLRRFCSDKRSVNIECVMGSLADNIHIIHGAVSSLDGTDRDEPVHLNDALAEIIGCCMGERMVVVFDEVPYLLDAAEHLGSSLQHFVDSIVRDTGSMVIVCGSSMSVMRRETTDYDRPLYGRFPQRMEVGPLSFRECRSFHPRMDPVDNLKLYLTLGGVPKFHLDRDTSTYREYIERHLLSPAAEMAGEGEAMVMAEFAPAGRYMAVVNAVSDGATLLKTISERTGIQRTTCSRCIDGFVSVGILGTVEPMMGAPKRSVYRISDPMTAFCQGVVRESKAYRLRGPSDIYDVVSSRIDTFLGIRFQDHYRRYVVDN